MTERTEQLEATNRRLQAEIAERQRAMVELERLASFPQLNPNPISEVDETGRVYYINPTAARLFPDLHCSERHAWLANWTEAVHACQDSPTHVCTREVVVDDRHYEQVVHYLVDMRRLSSLRPRRHCREEGVGGDREDGSTTGAIERRVGAVCLRGIARPSGAAADRYRICAIAGSKI